MVFLVKLLERTPGGKGQKVMPCQNTRKLAVMIFWNRGAGLSYCQMAAGVAN
jgi:hypothetical protein